MYTIDDPLAKVRGLSSHIYTQTIQKLIYINTLQPLSGGILGQQNTF